MPKALSALREIKKEVEPIILWQPFVRITHELLYDRGPFKIHREAIQALRVAAEEHVVEVLGEVTLHVCIGTDVLWPPRISGYSGD